VRITAVSESNIGLAITVKVTNHGRIASRVPHIARARIGTVDEPKRAVALGIIDRNRGPFAWGSIDAVGIISAASLGTVACARHVAARARAPDPIGISAPALIAVLQTGQLITIAPAIVLTELDGHGAPAGDQVRQVAWRRRVGVAADGGTSAGVT